MAGMRGINERQMRQAMKKMGITNRNINDVIEVIIRTPTKDIVITNAEVSVMTMQGVDTYQVNGTAVERAPGMLLFLVRYYFVFGRSARLFAISSSLGT